MDKTILVESDIREGEKLIRALDKSEPTLNRPKFSLTGALWFYYPKTQEWRLLLVSPLVDIIGPRRSYDFIQNVIQDFEPHLGISITNITVKSPEDELVRLLKVAFRTGQDSISGIRFTRNTINNIFIEDAYIYRLA